MTKLTHNQLSEFVNHTETRTDVQSGHTQHYLNYLTRFNKGHYVSWNWAAAFFGVIWVLYRCMPVLGAIIIAAIAFTATFSLIYLCFLKIIMFVFLGIFGDYFYLSTILARVRSKKRPGHGKVPSIILLAIAFFTAPFVVYTQKTGFSLSYTYMFYARMIGWEKPLKKRSSCGRAFPKVTVVQNKSLKQK